MADSVIGLTVGDPAGVGPEIVDAALTSRLLDPGFDYRVIGPTGERFALGEPSRESAQAAWDALEESVRLLKAEKICAVVTGPISKAAMYEIGFTWPGQTEFFAERFEVGDNFGMLLTGKHLHVALVTIHVPLSQVAGLLTTDEIVRVGGLMGEFLELRLDHQPRIAVAGFNPHAGESGKIGDEEERLIAPAIARLQEQFGERAAFTGPHPPDTVFHECMERRHDGVLCMYHDQGLIPLKMHAFHEGVNVTLGLPIVRCSPDHGTAFDIAGKNLAHPNSYISACRLAAELIHRKRSRIQTT